ncbi:MAG: site-specific integrase [Akkermansia sp.]
MASYYKRSDSPFYWLRLKRADGSRCGRATKIRHDAPGALRKVVALVNEETKKEAVFRSQESQEHFKTWVLAFFDREYKNESTRVRYRTAWNHLSLFFNLRHVVHPGEVSYSIVQDYILWRMDTKMKELYKWRTCTKNCAIVECKVLSRVMTEAVRLGYIFANPCVSMGLKRNPPAEKREITPQEEDIIMGALKQGCRLSEVQVPVEYIDLQNGVIKFLGKGHRWHEAPLHKDVRPIAEDAITKGQSLICKLPVKASGIWSHFFDSLGMKGLTFHCTRVTVVTRLARAGFSEAQSMQYVGHSSSVVHAIYRKLRARDVISLGEAL